MDDNNRHKAEAVDINSPSLPLENMEVDADKDQFAALPVIEDGTYRAKLVQKAPDSTIGGLWLRGIDKKNRGYLRTGIEARIVEPGQKFDNWPVFDNFVSTMINPMTGTNKIVGILKQSLGHDVPRSITDRELAVQLGEALQGEPESGITTQQEAYCPTCEKTVAKGQKRIPQGKPMECPKCGTECSIQARILKYFPATQVTVKA